MGNTFLIDSIDMPTRMHNDGVGNFWFYHKDSFPVDEPLLYKQIVASATTNIDIWDPYFNVAPNNDCNIFDSINTGVTIKLLTQKGSTRIPSYKTEVHNALKLKIIPALNIRFGMRVIDNGRMSDMNWLFHDRYLIIDNADVYLIGASVGWHTKIENSTGIYKVEHADTKQFIRSIFTKYWDKVSLPVNEIPVQFLHP